MDNLYFLILIAVVYSGIFLIKRFRFNLARERRRKYYREVYLKSDDWRKKRYVVLKRDNWICTYCGDRATEVHHTRYARNIGREPIIWLESVCKSCTYKRVTNAIPFNP